MAEITKRDEIQHEGKSLWLESDRKNTLIFGTGFGKSKIALEIIKELFDSETLVPTSKILLLTNSTQLRDTNWKEEFIKWEMGHIYEYITSECYQTTYKWENTSWDLVIADEVDFCLTDMYSLFFTNNKCSMILGLTGFIDDTKRVSLELIAPVLIEYSTQDAQDAGLLNSTQIVFVEYTLSRDPKDIEVKYKDKLTGADKTFTQSENEAYAYIENVCNITWGGITKIKDKEARERITAGEANELGKLIQKNRRATTDRKALLFSGIASRKVCNALKRTILDSGNNKVLIFSMRTEQGLKLSENTYTGKNKKDNTALEDLSSGVIRDLAVCKAVDRGVNLIGVNNEIMESYEGSETAFQQRHGRGCRLLPDQKMYLYIMLPYYFKKVKVKDNPNAVAYKREPTQMVKWAASMMQNFRVNNPITITYDEGRDTFITN